MNGLNTVIDDLEIAIAALNRASGTAKDAGAPMKSLHTQIELAWSETHNAVAMAEKLRR